MAGLKSALAISKSILAKLRMRYSQSYHEKVVDMYWKNAPATHASMDGQKFAFWAAEIGKVIRRCIGDGEKLVLDHGAGEGSIARHLSNTGGIRLLYQKNLKNTEQY